MLTDEIRMAVPSSASPHRHMAPPVQPEIAWLSKMGVIDLDSAGSWELTELGKRAMERFWQTAAPDFAKRVRDRN